MVLVYQLSQHIKSTSRVFHVGKLLIQKRFFDCLWRIGILTMATGRALRRNCIPITESLRVHHGQIAYSGA